MPFPPVAWRVLEITLRSDAALESIRRIAAEVPEVTVGAGTLTRPEHFGHVREAGGRFAVSPGLTPRLAAAAAESGLAFLPGVMTTSEALAAMEHGFSVLKLFPATVAGGVGMLKAIRGPLPELRFCPTGGVRPENLREFLDLPNVICVGGSWVAPSSAVDAEDWGRITELARQATAPHEHRFEGRDTLALELARSIADDLRAAVAERGSASLVVSGGSTPRPLFKALSGISLPWEKVWVTLADERWVDADHTDSNERFVRRHLLVSEASKARFVGLKNAAATPEEGSEACEAAIGEIPRPFDVVILGMGGDAHTASLFPGVPELAEGLNRRSERLCLAVRPKTAPHPRMSLTLAALLRSRRVVVHVTGQEKWDVYQEALGTVAAEDRPIHAVLASGHPGLEVYWAS